MVKLFLIYGDYKESAVVDRDDYKVLAFREAESPEDALEKWRAERKIETCLLEEEIIIREVSEEKHLYCICDKDPR